MGELKMVAVSEIVMPAHRHRRRERTEQDELTASIKAIGIQTPLKLSKADDGSYELVAGEGRLLSARELAIKEVPAFIEQRDEKRDVAARVAENLAREDLSPADEAEEIKALLDAGYTTAQVSAITKMPKQRVSARLVLVELPEELRALYQHGGLPASSAATLKALHDARAELGEAIASVAKQDAEAAADCLADGPGPALQTLAHLVARMDARRKPPFALMLRRGDSWGRGLRFDPDQPGAIELKGEHGEWFKELSAAARPWDRPAIAFSDADLDAAVAYGAAFGEQGEYGCVYIHDRAWLTAHVNEVVLPRMRAHAERAKKERASAAQAASGQEGLAEADPRSLASKLGARFRRELRPRAHSANLDLGAALLKSFQAPALTREIALFIASEAIGAAGDRYGYGDGHARALAECAARVMPAWIGAQRKTLKSGRIKETATYLDGEQAERRMWRFIAEGKSAEEVLGRALAIFACGAHFQRECGALSKTPPRRYPANATARKALERITARVLPASLKRLEREKQGFDEMAQAKRLIADAKKERATKGAPSRRPRAKSSPRTHARRARTQARRTPTSESARPTPR